MTINAGSNNADQTNTSLGTRGSVKVKKKGFWRTLFNL